MTPEQVFFLPRITNTALFCSGWGLINLAIHKHGKAWLDFQDHITSKVQGGWVFRGQSDARHGLRPGVGRSDKCGPKPYSIDDEKFYFEEFRYLAPRVDPYIDTALEWLALGQHHGLPTRLLDWTFNPLVAAYFATEQNGVDGKIFMVQADKGKLFRETADKKLDPFDETHDKPILVRVPPHAARVTAQQGLFSVHYHPDMDWDLATSGMTHAILEIPSAEKDFFRTAIGAMGVDRTRLMTDMDAFCGDMARRYKER